MESEPCLVVESDDDFQPHVKGLLVEDLVKGLLDGNHNV